MCDLTAPSLGKLTELVVPEVIESDGRDEGERCTKLFIDWLSRSRGIASLNVGPTWEDLIEYIRNVDELSAAAERIQNKFLASK